FLGVVSEVVQAAFTQALRGLGVGVAKVAVLRLAIGVAYADRAGAPAQVAVGLYVFGERVKKGTASGHAPVQHVGVFAFAFGHCVFDSQTIAFYKGVGRSGQHLPIQRGVFFRIAVDGAVARGGLLQVVLR